MTPDETRRMIDSAYTRDDEHETCDCTRERGLLTCWSFDLSARERKLDVREAGLVAREARVAARQTWVKAFTAILVATSLAIWWAASIIVEAVASR